MEVKNTGAAGRLRLRHSCTREGRSSALARPCPLEQRIEVGSHKSDVAIGISRELQQRRMCVEIDIPIRGRLELGLNCSRMRWRRRLA